MTTLLVLVRYTLPLSRHVKNSVRHVRNTSMSAQQTALQLQRPRRNFSETIIAIHVHVVVRQGMLSARLMAGQYTCTCNVSSYPGPEAVELRVNATRRPNTVHRDRVDAMLRPNPVHRGRVDAMSTPNTVHRDRVDAMLRPNPVH